jgi:tetratricopeptide (TPR) repeat protein
VAHATFLGNGFVWLDHGDLQEGRAVLPLSRVGEAFGLRFGETGFYRPLVTLLHSLDAAVYRAWAPGYHLTNLLLHLGVVAAAPLFLRAFLGLHEREALLAALVFAVHPVTWIVGAIAWRPELLVALFTLLAVSAHLWARSEARPSRALIVAAGFALALASKETAVFWVPALILVSEAANVAKGGGEGGGGRGKTLAWLLTAEGLVLLLYLVVRARAVPETWRVTAEPLEPSQAFGTRLSTLGLLVLDLVQPSLPTLSDATRVVPATNPLAVAAACAILGTTLALFRTERRSPWWRALLWLGAALLPAANLVPLPRFRSPHYGYFAALPLAALIVLALRACSGRRAPWLRTALGLFVVAGAGATLLGGFRFRDDVHLFEPEVARDPAFREGHAELGAHWLRLGQFDRAAFHLERARTSTPGFIAYADRASILINLAGARLGKGLAEEADRLLQEASLLSPAPAQARLIAYNRALIAARRGEHERVIGLLTGHRQGPGWAATTRPWTSSTTSCLCSRPTNGTRPSSSSGRLVR